MTTTTVESMQLRSYIAGDWRNGAGDELVSVNPTRPHEIVAHGTAATHEDLNDAVAAARAVSPNWACRTLHDRGAVLSRAADVVAANVDKWGRELTREEGKPLAEARGEVARAAQILRYFSVAGDRQYGSVYSSPRVGEQILLVRRPVGVVAVITPFNFPIAIPAWKIAPALVYGNTVVWKPAEIVPLLALRLMEAFSEAGLPAGVCNLLFGNGDLGERLTDHKDIDAVTFTGSTAVGRAIASSAARRGVQTQAEMGGKNAAVVLADADIELSVEQIMTGAFRSTGQKCTATSRLVLDRTIADRVVDGLDRAVGRLRVGDPLDDRVDVGPLATAEAKRRVETGAAGALAAGALVVAKGSAPDIDGYFVAPTILEIDSMEADVWNDELFGPVLTVIRVDTAEEAFAAANSGEYGLSTAVFTQDITRALAAVDRMQVGVLHINSESAGADPHVPFGGARASGYGPREQGEAARDFFTSSTTVYLCGARPSLA